MSLLSARKVPLQAAAAWHLWCGSHHLCRLRSRTAPRVCLRCEIYLHEDKPVRCLALAIYNMISRGVLLLVVLHTCMPWMIASLPGLQTSSNGTAGHGHRGRPDCVLTSRRYIPSRLEKTWMQNVHVWQDDYCKYFDPQIPQMKELMNQIKMAQHITHDLQEEELLSKFVEEWQCHSKNMLFANRIEPLAAALRTFLAFCGGGGDLIDRQYLVLEAVHAQPSGGQRHHSRAFYFDVGASSYLQGIGGASQQYFVDSYKSLGITFDRMLLWEATRMDPNTIFNELPKELFAAYQVGLRVSVHAHWAMAGRADDLHVHTMQHASILGC
jgi:hypothetical protein